MDREEFGLLFTGAQDNLLKIVYSRTSEEAVAADLVQELALSMWKNRERIPQDTFVKYACGAIGRMVKKYHRTRIRRRKLGQYLPSDVLEGVAGEEPAPDAIMECSHPVDVAVANIDRAESSRQSLLLDAIIHWGEKGGIERSRGRSRRDVQVATYRAVNWLTHGNKYDPFDDETHPFGKLRGPLEAAIQEFAEAEKLCGEAVGESKRIFGPTPVLEQAKERICSRLIKKTGSEVSVGQIAMLLMKGRRMFSSDFPIDDFGDPETRQLMTVESRAQFDEGPTRRHREHLVHLGDSILNYRMNGKTHYLARAWHALRREYEPIHKKGLDDLAVTVVRRECLKVVVERLMEGERDPTTIRILSGDKPSA